MPTAAPPRSSSGSRRSRSSGSASSPGARLDRWGPRPILVIGAAALFVGLLATSRVDSLTAGVRDVWRGGRHRRGVWVRAHGRSGRRLVRPQAGGRHRARRRRHRRRDVGAVATRGRADRPQRLARHLRRLRDRWGVDPAAVHPARRPSTRASGSATVALRRCTGLAGLPAAPPLGVRARPQPVRAVRVHRPVRQGPRCRRRRGRGAGRDPRRVQRARQDRLRLARAAVRLVPPLPRSASRSMR